MEDGVSAGAECPMSTRVHIPSVRPSWHRHADFGYFRYHNKRPSVRRTLPHREKTGSTPRLPTRYRLRSLCFAFHVITKGQDVKQTNNTWCRRLAAKSLPCHGSHRGFESHRHRNYARTHRCVGDGVVDSTPAPSWKRWFDSNSPLRNVTPRRGCRCLGR